MKKLESQNIEDILGLTPMQEGMLFHYTVNKDNNLYFSQIIVGLSGYFDSRIFKESWKAITITNEMLRTVFRWEKLKRPVQVILKNHNIPIIEHDFSYLNEKDSRVFADKVILNDRETLIDITSEPFRVTLIKLPFNNFEMVISCYHIIIDGWSNGIIIKEFIENYNKLINGKTLEIKTKNKYKIFLKWYINQDKQKNRNYWYKYLSGFSKKTIIPMEQCIQGISGTGYYRYQLSLEESSSIFKFVEDRNITLASLLYTAWGILLQKYSYTQDVLFGTTVSGRPHIINGIENMVGLFINTLPLRFNYVSNFKILDILALVNKDIHERSEYEWTSIIDIKSCSELSPRENFFDSIVVIENYPIDESSQIEENSLRVKNYSVIDKTNFDITLGIITFEGIKIILEYNNKKFDFNSIKKSCKHFLNILSEIVTYSVQNLSDINMLSNEEIFEKNKAISNRQNAFENIEINFNF